MKNLYSDTIVAPATTPGTGAISIVRLSGPEAFAIADAVVQLKNGTIAESKAYTIHFGEVESLDEVLVSVFRAPHSYTGEDMVEISTHASSYIVSELIGLLMKAGARFAQPGEFTRRAFLHGKMDLAQAEAVADLISSRTAAAHRVAMNQLKGGFSRELALLRSQLLEMASLLELELDFSEEDVEFANRDQLMALLDATLEQVQKLASSFRQGNMIKTGIPVAIVGPTNAGKSSLLNALLEEDRAIVSDIAGTTRDTIEETLVLDGTLFRFIDTAGIRDSADVIEKIGIDRSFRKLSEAEIVLGVLDAASSQDELAHSLNLLARKVDFEQQKLVLVLNKADLLDEKGINKVVTMCNNYVLNPDYKYNTICISVKTSQGLLTLHQTLISLKNELIPNADTTFVTNSRHYEALLHTASALQDCRTSLSRGISSDLVAEDLRSALRAINEILGTDLLDPETILHSIFSRHCIGK